MGEKHFSLWRNSFIIYILYLIILTYIEPEGIWEKNWSFLCMEMSDKICKSTFQTSIFTLLNNEKNLIDWNRRWVETDLRFSHFNEREIMLKRCKILWEVFNKINIKTSKTRHNHDQFQELWALIYTWLIKSNPGSHTYQNASRCVVAVCLNASA